MYRRVDGAELVVLGVEGGCRGGLNGVDDRVEKQQGGKQSRGGGG